MKIEFIKAHPSGASIGLILSTENKVLAKGLIRDGYAKEYLGFKKPTVKIDLKNILKKISSWVIR